MRRAYSSFGFLIIKNWSSSKQQLGTVDRTEVRGVLHPSCSVEWTRRLPNTFLWKLIYPQHLKVPVMVIKEQHKEQGLLGDPLQPCLSEDLNGEIPRVSTCRSSRDPMFRRHGDIGPPILQTCVFGRLLSGSGVELVASGSDLHPDQHHRLSVYHYGTIYLYLIQPSHHAFVFIQCASHSRRISRRHGVA